MLLCLSVCSFRRPTCLTPQIVHPQNPNSFTGFATIRPNDTALLLCRDISRVRCAKVGRILEVVAMGLSSTSTTTTKFSSFRPICPSYFRGSRSCSCSASKGAAFMPLSNALHRSCVEMASGLTVNLERRGERIILASRNYSTASSMGVTIVSSGNTKTDWSQKAQSLKETLRSEKSEHLQEYKMRYARVKNEHVENGNSYSVMHGQTYTLINDKARSQKQALSSSRDHFVDYKDHAASLSFSAELKSSSGSNITLNNVKNQSLKETRRSENSECLRKYKMGYAQVKNEDVEDGDSYPVMHDQNYTITHDKAGIPKQAFSSSCKDHFISHKDHTASVLYSTEMKTSGGNITLNDVNSQAIVVKSGISSECISRESTWTNGSTVVKSNVAVDKKSGETVYKSKLTKISKTGVQNDGSLPMEMLEHWNKRDCNVIERQSAGLIESNQTNGIPAVVSDTEKLSNTKVASQHPDVRKRLNSIYGKVLVVNNVSVAEEVASKLTNQYKHLVHACDTEVAKIDVKQETPIHHGEIICFSIYSGPEADFGNGKSCIWVDALDGGGRDILNKFAPFFNNQSIKKVWHNYSFDNHVIENYEIPVRGFHADTMHMARLWNSSRRTDGGYSLEALTSDKRVMTGFQSHYGELIGKVSMKTIFGKNKVKKDGSEGKIITIASVEELQRQEREPWICYSALDAISTWHLYESLKQKLCDMPWNYDGKVAGNMFDFYKEYLQPFGELLVRMETEGILINRAYLAGIEKVAKAEQEVAANRFRNWACKYCPDAKYMNVGSDSQLRQLFFGGIMNRKDPTEILENEKTFKVPNVDKVIEEGKKTPRKYRNIKLHRIGDFPAEMFTASGWPSVSGDALKILAGKVSAEYDFMDNAIVDDCKLKTAEHSETKKSSVLKNVDTRAYGAALQAFPSQEEGIEACHALASLCEVCSIDSLISNFILPLQGGNISGKSGRIHCSLNINTETGRLSARRPNLQNQPALEKDRYKIRQAFIAAPGNSLIVADYGQLELRILAHLADCKSMLEAFKAGGDFHSRTAMNMYPHIREAIDKREVLLEWHGEDKPPVPLLKDAFGSERRKAKMLNFSIAYGKTPVGLARDWKVSVEEARETVDLWYKQRKEVRNWQEARKKEARENGRVHTLLGRARVFPSLAHASNAQKGHIERAAINTPVQGSAADVAMCAMLAISKNARLKELGWKLLLQIHDEVILEGPTESSEEAKAIVVECMSKPFDGKNILKVGLSVDAKCAQNWYSAK